jgi:hypothetical protein
METTKPTVVFVHGAWADNSGFDGSILIMGTSSLGPKQLDKLAKHSIFARLPAVTRGHISRSTSGNPRPWSSPRR